MNRKQRTAKAAQARAHQLQMERRRLDATRAAMKTTGAAQGPSEVSSALMRMGGYEMDYRGVWRRMPSRRDAALDQRLYGYSVVKRTFEKGS